MPGRKLRSLTLSAILVGGTALAEPVIVEAHYADARLAAFESFSLPRTFLYDRNGQLLAEHDWPAALASIKAQIANAECCVSEDEGPCVPKPFTPPLAEHFAGLLDRNSATLGQAQLPDKAWLLVQYHADWCAPCLQETAALQEHFAASSQSTDFVWLRIDMSRLPQAQEAAAPASTP